MRQFLTTIAALFVALMIYGALIVMLFQRMTSVLIVCTLQGTARSSPPLIAIANGQVHVFGHTLPLTAVIAAAAVPPIWWLAARMYERNLRRTRERLGQCLECGQPLSGKRGRCPGCGERFERSLPLLPLSLQSTRKSLAHR